MFYSSLNNILIDFIYSFSYRSVQLFSNCTLFGTVIAHFFNQSNLMNHIIGLIILHDPPLVTIIRKLLLLSQLLLLAVTVKVPGCLKHCERGTKMCQNTA